MSEEDGLSTTDKWLIGTLVPAGVILLSVGSFFAYKYAKPKASVAPDAEVDNEDAYSTTSVAKIKEDV